MPTHESDSRPTLKEIFETLEKVEHRESEYDLKMTSRRLTRQSFFENACWAILVSGFTAKGARTCEEKAAKNRINFRLGNPQHVEQYRVQSLVQTYGQDAEQATKGFGFYIP